MGKMQHRLLSAALVALFLILAIHIGKETFVYASGQDLKKGKEIKDETTASCVVIDAGHGGDDPGKVGINGAKEKDINLEIAKMVRKYLEANDVRVVMTREEDEMLCDSGASNKKVQDMKNRIALIEAAEPDIVVSIHQNSYPEEYVHGAQVFYYTGSATGQKLAESIQSQLVRKVDPDNRRQVKANDSYYLLKKTAVPIVIVECGFLSNSAEAEKLCDPDYQEYLAWTIHMGILQYLNESGER